MELTYSCSKQPDIDEIIALYKKAAMPRPTDDKARMKKMFACSNLVVTAWDENKLVGICRCITDWAWCCYLSDLVVDTDLKKSGIGRQLIEQIRKEIGNECMLLLLSVPTAMDYYPKVGFQKEDRAFMIPRTQ